MNDNHDALSSSEQGDPYELRILGQLKEHLKRKRISQRRLSKHLSVSHSLVSQMLSGYRGMRLGKFLRIIELTDFLPTYITKAPPQPIIIQTPETEKLAREILELKARVKTLETENAELTGTMALCERLLRRSPQPTVGPDTMLFIYSVILPGCE